MSTTTSQALGDLARLIAAVAGSSGKGFIYNPVVGSSPKYEGIEDSVVRVVAESASSGRNYLWMLSLAPLVAVEGFYRFKRATSLEYMYLGVGIVQLGTHIENDRGADRAISKLEEITEYILEDYAVHEPGTGYLSSLAADGVNISEFAMRHFMYTVHRFAGAIYYSNSKFYIVFMGLHICPDTLSVENSDVSLCRCGGFNYRFISVLETAAMLSGKEVVLSRPPAGSDRILITKSVKSNDNLMALVHDDRMREVLELCIDDTESIISAILEDPI